METPKRDSPEHRECQRVCEHACVWWHRFIQDNGGLPLTDYNFQDHVLAVLYIYAEGMKQNQHVILPPSPVLQTALPGSEKLQSGFASLAKCQYTKHERVCRQRILAWMNQ